MKKILCILLIIIVLCSAFFLFVGCNAKSSEYDNSYAPDSDFVDKDYAENGEIYGDSERKIIYTANVSLSVEEVEKTINDIRALLTEDEWIEKSSTSSYSSEIVLRVKSERLNGFIEDLSKFGTVSSSQVSSKDVSLEYYDVSLRKQTLENEYKRLNELLKTAENMSDILVINKRLAEIDSEMQKLQNTLNKYDGLIEYSTVTVYVYKKGEEPKKATFGDKVGTAYSVSGKILEGLGVFLITVLPYLGFSAILAVAIILIKKHVKKKKQAKADERNSEKIENKDDKVIPLNKDGKAE